MVKVEVTAAAREEVIKIASKQGKADSTLRLFVQGGGCSGLTYGMTFDKAETGDEVVFQGNGLKVVVDKASAPLLEGITVDYLLGLEASGFKIHNPNAKETCSCGKSFSA